MTNRSIGMMLIKYFLMKTTDDPINIAAVLVTSLCFETIRWRWPAGSHDHLEGLPETDAVGDRHPGGRRLRSGCWLQGMMHVFVCVGVLQYCAILWGNLSG